MKAGRITLGRLGLGLIGLVTLASAMPLVAFLAAGVLADGFGCALDEGSVHPCIIAGIDVGETLYTAFVGGWLALLTAPVLLVTTAFWLGYGLKALLRRRRGRPAR